MNESFEGMPTGWSLEGVSWCYQRAQRYGTDAYISGCGRYVNGIVARNFADWTLKSVIDWMIELKLMYPLMSQPTERNAT
jgi:hypothetical protein